MNQNINWIAYFRELLIKAVPENSSSISQCVLKGWLHGLGRNLGLNSIRLYLFDDRSNKTLIYHIYGDRELWRDIDITRFSKEKTKFKKLFFVKIRHIRENGQFLILGYLAFHTENYVTDELMSSLEVLCMLYGNYILKRLITGQNIRMNRILPQIYSIATMDELPGTKILKLLDYLHRLAGFNYGIFCSVYERTIIAEYIANHKGGICLKKHQPWNVGKSFIDCIENSAKMHRHQLSDIPRVIINFVLHNDKRNPDMFSLLCFPVHVDGELVGLWMFVFSENNPYTESNISSILEGTFPLLEDSYKYLFQRRFNAMIVNPIFQNRDTRIKQNSVFIIMPFTQEWSNDIWEQVLKPAVQEIGMIPIRADDLYGQNIMEDVWLSILQSALIICDTTGRNPNVFYELGIAHTLGKKGFVVDAEYK